MNTAIDIGSPLHFQGLSVFPLFAESAAVEYELASAAIPAGSVTVEEISETGSVPELMVENNGDHPVLFLEGEQLVGAKQNRILNTSVLVPAHRKIRIPVSCVEQRRWSYRSRRFRPGEASSPSSLRLILSRSVTQSLCVRGEPAADQGRIWAAVQSQQQSLGVRSSTRAYSDTVEKHQTRLAEFREHLPYVAGASGLAVAVDGRVVALDIFDKPSTCEQVWNKMLNGHAIDALQSSPTNPPPDVEVVRQLIRTLATASWTAVPSAGEGEAFRLETDNGVFASELTYQGSLVHASVLAGVSGAAAVQ